MSEHEIVAQLRDLAPDELAQVEALINRLRSARAAADDAADLRPATVEDAWRMLSTGWCHSDGRPIADTVDDVLYGPGR